MSQFLENQTNLKTLTDFNASHNLYRNPIKMNQLKVKTRQMKMYKDMHHTQKDVTSSLDPADHLSQTTDAQAVNLYQNDAIKSQRY